MRGPLESLIAQARQEQITQKASPSLFAKAHRTLYSAGGMPVGVSFSTKLRIAPTDSRQSLCRRARVAATSGFSAVPNTDAIRSDSGLSFRILFGRALRNQQCSLMAEEQSASGEITSFCPTGRLGHCFRMKRRFSVGYWRFEFEHGSTFVSKPNVWKI